MWQTFISVAFLLLLNGCTVGPNYRAPEINAPSQWNSPLKAGESNVPVDLTLWWKNFGDSNLDSLMEMAIENNYTLRMAEDHVREARAQRDVAYGGLWPFLAGTVSYTRNRYGHHAFPPLPASVPLNFNEYNIGFDASWEIDLFGGTRRAVEAASAEVGAAQYSQRDVLVSLLAEVARNYIQMRGFQQRLDILRQNIQTEQKILELTNSRFTNGLGSQLDVEEAKAILAQIQSEIPSLEAGFQESAYHLSVLAGQEPGALMENLASQKPIPMTPPVVPVGLPSDLLQRRPDVQRAERELAAATARIGVAKSELFPKFSLTGVAGLESLSANDWVENASRYWTAGPTMQWEIFEAGRIRAQVRVQDARQQQALDSYQQTVLTALEEVESALTVYAKEKVRHESLSQSVEADQKAQDLSVKLYKSGLANFLNVLDAERSLYGAEDELVQSDQALALNLVQLYKALGGGWQEQ